MDLKKFTSLNFVGRLLLSAIFINAIPGKITNFTAQAGYLTSRGFPEPLSMIMMVIAIALLIGGTALLIFTERIKLAALIIL